MGECMKCGAEDWVITSQMGALEMCRCKSCGAEEWVHVNYVIEAEEVHLMPVILAAAQPVSAQQIKELRQKFPVLAKMSVMSIRKRVDAGEAIEVGRYTQEKAEGVVQALASVGLRGEVGAPS